MDVIQKLKKLIEQNGESFLSKEPYLVYKHLVATNEIDKQLAGGILMVLVEGCYKNKTCDNNSETLSAIIQNKCCFNKNMADRLSKIFTLLFSDENLVEWQKNELAGWKQFKKSELNYHWQGFSVWNENNGSISCYYEADIVLKPLKDIKEDEKLAELLKENSFLTEKVIAEHYEKSLKRHLDYEFDYYITCEEYYEPTVEDFHIEYCIKEWCDKNGFELISCEGTGEDDGYEPTIRGGGWY